jgi:AhpD family alkylhydroperoxidase
MQARMTQPVFIVPDALKALRALSASANDLGVPATTLELVYLRAGQINGCGVCVELHSIELKKAGETDERIFAVAAWRDAPYFTEAERAALALTEAVTRIADRPESVSDEIWAEARRHYDERGMSALLIAISAINVWNRLNVATRQVVGEWKGNK